MGVDGVILAAGSSSRAGTNKLFLELDGKSVLERCIDSMSSVCKRIIIVGGHQFDELTSKLASFSNLDIVFNQHFTDGMFSSVLQGISQIQEDRFFLCPGDHPLIKKATYLSLLCEPSGILIPTYRGHNGHPVLIASAHIPGITSGNYLSLRDFVKANNPRFLEVPDPGITMDIDTMEDYEKIRSTFMER